MLANNIKPKFWKWAEGLVFGIEYRRGRFCRVGNSGFKRLELQELIQTGLIEGQNQLKITREAFYVILERINNGNLFLSSPLKYCTKEELYRIALRNEFKVCQGWGAYWQENYSFLKRTYLPSASCKHGHLYWVHARNLRLALYNEEDDSFVGIRSKFDRKYLTTEYHWDTGVPFGTVKPLKELCKTKFVPIEDNQKLFDYLAEWLEPEISIDDYLV